MTHQTNDKNLNLAATLAPSSASRGLVRGRTFAGALALGAALTLVLFAGRAEAGLAVQNGLSAVNGMKIHNGFSLSNGMKIHNGLSAVNGMKIHNGFSLSNGMKIHNGLSAVNGMKIHNGVTVSGIWVMRRIDPSRPLFAAAKARRQ